MFLSIGYRKTFIFIYILDVAAKKCPPMFLLSIGFFYSRDSLTDGFGDSKCENGDYRKSPGLEDDILSASAHQRPSGRVSIRSRINTRSDIKFDVIYLYLSVELSIVDGK